MVLDYPISSSPPPIGTLISHVINPESGAVLSVSNETFKTPLLSAAYTPLDTQLEIQLPIIELSSSLLLFHHRYGNLIFLLPCASTTPSFLPFEFIFRLIETLESYLNPPLVSPKIESNFDLIALILSEMIDGGVPTCTEPDAIHGLVQPSGAISRLLSTASGYVYFYTCSSLLTVLTFSFFFLSLCRSSSFSTSNISDIPWRRANVRHTTNELFVDIIETISAVIPPTRKSSGSSIPASSSAFYSGPVTFSDTRPLISTVRGAIYVTSRLSGLPEVSLILDTNGKPILYPSFHPCIRFERFENFSLEKSHEAQMQYYQQKQIETSQNQTGSNFNSNNVSANSRSSTSSFSFIPPDGKFLLASYELDNVGTGLVCAELKTGFGPKRDEFEVRVSTLMSRDTKYIENLSVTITSDGDQVSGMKTLRMTTGEFSSSDGSTAKWTFSEKIPLGWNATLRGVLIKNSLDDEELENNNNQSFGSGIDKDANAWLSQDSSSDKKVPNLISLDPGIKSRNVSGRNTPKLETNEKEYTPDTNTGEIVMKEKKSKKKSKKSKKSKEPKEGLDDDNGRGTPDSSSTAPNDDFANTLLSRGGTPLALSDNGKSVAPKHRPSPSPEKPLPRPVFPTHVTISYKAVGQVPSGTKVKSLKINNTRGSNDSHAKIFKGVRYVTLTGDFIVR